MHFIPPRRHSPALNAVEGVLRAFGPLTQRVSRSCRLRLARSSAIDRDQVTLRMIVTLSVKVPETP
jgi:hypothetical protein